MSGNAGPSRTSVRPRTSPPDSQNNASDGNTRPQKRARKAINCEPCRSSKLKCDRNRPCSSCVLRGTAALCYQDSRGNDPREPVLRGDDNKYARIDPAQEIAALRHSLDQLEAYIFPHHRGQVVELVSRRRGSIVMPGFKQESNDSDMATSEKAEPSAPGLQMQGGFYVGPTTAATQLLISDGPAPSSTSSDSLSRHSSPAPSYSQNPSFFATLQSFPDAHAPTETVDYDQDLLGLLPPLNMVNILLHHYFTYCNWIYRHVNQTAFLLAWEKFREGKGGNDHRMVVSTLTVILAIAMNYLPDCADWSVGLVGEEIHGWENLNGLRFDATPEMMGAKLFEISTISLKRHREWLSNNPGHGRYSLELVELLLIRCHYRTLSKTENEEVWAVRGEIVSIAMAMGLHRDPGKGRMPSMRELEKKSDKDREREKLKMEREREVAERRRWAWWHTILLERWQAFMFGRPLAIAAHHFDTQLPSYCPPSLDPTGRLYEPNLAMFRLSWILGDIMDSAVSVRAEPYVTILQHDRALVNWMERLPAELDLDEYRVTKALASTDPATRRLGVQSVVLRTSYYHIRFTLHRPYTTNPDANLRYPSAPQRYPFNPQSLDIAVSAASDLITLITQSHVGAHANHIQHPSSPSSPHSPAPPPPSFPGHLNWAAFHTYAAAMFFSFQLISNPNQPGASLFRSNIRRALGILDQLRPTTDVAEQAFEILHALEPLSSGEGQKGDKEKARILSLVKNLSFPYHSDDSHRRGGTLGESPRSVGTPGAEGVRMRVENHSSLSPQYDGTVNRGYATSSMRGTTGGTPMVYPVQTSQQQPQLQQPQQHQPFSYTYTPPAQRFQAQYDPSGVDDMWGAAVGFGQGEWVHFLSGFRPGQEPGGNGV